MQHRARSRRWIGFLVPLLLLVWLGARPLVAVLVNLWWFDAAGHAPLYVLRLKSQVGLFFAVGGATAAFVGVNLALAVRKNPLDLQRLAVLMPDVPLDVDHLSRLIRLGYAAVVLLPAAVLATAATQGWLGILTFLHRQPFDLTEPVFGLDVGFYTFVLPVLQAGQQGLSVVLGLTLMVVAFYHVGLEVLVFKTAPTNLPRGPRQHLLILGALFFANLAWGWWLSRFPLLIQREGVVWGAGYADVHARIPAMWTMVGLSVLCALSLLVTLRRSSWRGPVAVGITYIAGRILLVGAWPAVVQDYVVKPSELDKERTFLKRNIAFSRQAFALDRIEVHPFDAETDLEWSDITENPLTIENVRVWDARPLLTTYGQLQEIRLYYDFHDVDVDRYPIDGSPRQVMLSARELNYANVPAQARSWVNEHFQYTHGYGLTMSPVNRVTPEGLPELLVQDLPPQSIPSLPIERPEIYYGELTDRYVFVRSEAKEFDYPMGAENVYTTYQGEGGVPLGNLFRKAVFSAHFGSLDILLSSYLQSESRVLFRRRIQERVETLAPFLSYDGDPYLVVADGHLYWMMDAYTTTARFPYAEPIQTRRLGRFNYMRNAVKVVVDAYDGSVDFYVADAEDPLVAVYRHIFPDSFRPLDDMPEVLRSHVRYPSDFFDVQAAMYRAYHMMDPTVFYNKEDMWSFPRELYAGDERPMESYYLIMKLRGEEEAEFILLRPFTPTNRDNMISWMAARCDPEAYGRIILFQFPKQKLIYGPRQIEARIDQDPDISQQITLWSQSGSQVVRGNLLVIPVEDSLMYVEPLYLQAESSQLPELKRVIVSYDNRIAMRATLEESLRVVFGATQAEEEAKEAAAQAETALGPAARPGIWSDLAAEARTQFDEARTRQQQGDWAGYGEALTQLEQTLEKLAHLAGEFTGTDEADDTDPSAPQDGAPETPTPTPAPGAGTP